MLSVFPDLYNFGNLVPDLFRLVLGLFLLKAAWEEFMAVKSGGAPRYLISWSILDFIAGAFILLGYLIQPTALAYVVFLILTILFKGRLPFVQKYSNEFLILLAASFLSLAILGPGLWSIDLPL